MEILPFKRGVYHLPDGTKVYMRPDGSYCTRTKRGIERDLTSEQHSLIKRLLERGDDRL